MKARKALTPDRVTHDYRHNDTTTPSNTSLYSQQKTAQKISKNCAKMADCSRASDRQQRTLSRQQSDDECYFVPERLPLSAQLHRRFNATPMLLSTTAQDLSSQTCSTIALQCDKTHAHAKIAKTSRSATSQFSGGTICLHRQAINEQKRFKSLSSEKPSQKKHTFALLESPCGRAFIKRLWDSEIFNALYEGDLLELLSSYLVRGN